MASLLTNAEKTTLNEAMDALHDTFARDIQIIKEAVNRKINNPNQSFKEHLNNVIAGVTPVTTSKTPLQNEPILTELRLIRNYLEKLTLLQEVSNG